MYCVIDAAGALLVDDQPVNQRTIRDGVAGWFDLVRVHPSLEMAAFVNDDGHVIGLDRNPVGACVIALLGAKTEIYAGNVVLTGFDPYAEYEAVDLTSDQVDIVRERHEFVTRALASEELVDELNAGRVREYAAWVSSAPTPSIVVLSGADAVAHILGRRPS